MKISVIVSAYNQPHFLDLALTSYGLQTDRDFDVIVADDGSGPEIAEVIESHKGRWNYPLSHVWQEDKGFRKCTILNKAISASDADCLIFTDSDCVAMPDLVSAHRRSCEAGFYVYGNRIVVSEVVGNALTAEDVLRGRLFSFFWVLRYGFPPSWPRRFRMMAIPSRLGMRLDRKLWSQRNRDAYGRFPGGNSSCLREDALAISGFNETLGYGGEDREFGVRLRNHGIAGKRLKYTGLILNFDHPRPYRDEAEMERNAKRIEEVTRSGATCWR